MVLLVLEQALVGKVAVPRLLGTKGMAFSLSIARQLDWRAGRLHGCSCCRQVVSKLISVRFTRLPRDLFGRVLTTCTCTGGANTNGMACRVGGSECGEAVRTEARHWRHVDSWASGLAKVSRSPAYSVNVLGECDALSTHEPWDTSKWPNLIQSARDVVNRNSVADELQVCSRHVRSRISAISGANNSFSSSVSSFLSNVVDAAGNLNLGRCWGAPSTRHTAFVVSMEA